MFFNYFILHWIGSQPDSCLDFAMFNQVLFMSIFVWLLKGHPGLPIPLNSVRASLHCLHAGNVATLERKGCFFSRRKFVCLSCLFLKSLTFELWAIFVGRIKWDPLQSLEPPKDFLCSHRTQVTSKHSRTCKNLIHLIEFLNIYAQRNSSIYSQNNL